MKVFAAILILIFAYNAVSACNCSSPNEEKKKEAVKTSSAIFFGKVISVTPAENGEINVKFHVLESWKGVETNEIIIKTNRSMCGAKFNVGESKIIYSYGTPPSANVCSMLLVDEKLVRETFGDGKRFDEMPAPQAETQETEGFFAWLWRKITLIFS
jgi:hypothetical protein